MRFHIPKNTQFNFILISYRPVSYQNKFIPSSSNSVSLQTHIQTSTSNSVRPQIKFNSRSYRVVRNQIKFNSSSYRADKNPIEPKQEFPFTMATKKESKWQETEEWTGEMRILPINFTPHWPEVFRNKAVGWLWRATSNRKPIGWCLLGRPGYPIGPTSTLPQPVRG